MNTVFLALGSNIGDRKKNCEEGVAHLGRHPNIEIRKISGWHETTAECLPGETQPDFINGVVSIETTLEPDVLHRICKEIEGSMGREPSEKKWRPRVIDLDIILWGSQIWETGRLKIPHPLMHQRRFVLEPLAEIAPDFIHPILKKTVAQLLQGVLQQRP